VSTEWYGHTAVVPCEMGILSSDEYRWVLWRTHSWALKEQYPLFVAACGLLCHSLNVAPTGW
jgi:hypothetical protein